MNTLIITLCRYGTLLLDRSERGYVVIFEPHSKNYLPSNMQSTVMIVRNSPEEAVTSLDQYIKAKKHWSEYSGNFFTGDS